MGEVRKSRAKSRYPELNLNQVEILAGLGLTDVEIANVLDISKRTLDYYKKKHPEFYDALKRGKDKADARVLQSLYKQAIEGNVTACIFWLKNRRRQDWRDRVDLEHSGSLEQKIGAMTEEEKMKRLYELKQKIDSIKIPKENKS